MIMGKNREFDELMETQLTPEMMKPEYQEELFQVVTKTPEGFRAVIEQQELSLEGINRNEAGDYEQRGKPPNQSVLKAALDRVDKRMLRESPALKTYKLEFKGGALVPDIKAYEREVE